MLIACIFPMEYSVSMDINMLGNKVCYNVKAEEKSPLHLICQCVKLSK